MSVPGRAGRDAIIDLYLYERPAAAYNRSHAEVLDLLAFYERTSAASSVP